MIDKGVLKDTPGGFLDWSRDHPALRNVTLDNVNRALPESFILVATDWRAGICIARD